MIVEDEKLPAASLLSVEALKASYDESIILRGIDMVVPPNSVVALLGRNGVGKTSLLRSIMGLMPKTEGRLSGHRRARRAGHARLLHPHGREARHSHAHSSHGFRCVREVRVRMECRGSRLGRRFSFPAR